MKRLVVCCDGTWNSLEMECPSNVVKLSQACQAIATDGVPQVVYYDEGIGTANTLKDKWLGGALGWGINANIQEAYRFLCLNYAPGDEIYLFGFSRGAYTVRSLAGMVYCCGLLPRRKLDLVPEAFELYRDRSQSRQAKLPAVKALYDLPAAAALPEVAITALGCFDTVGALGVPKWLGLFPRKKYEFHDTQLNRKIQHALHAIAIDERRKSFDVTHMDLSDGASTIIKEVWFPGNHGCVGGGTADWVGLSNAALRWMTTQIRDLGLGLEFDEDWLQEQRTAHKTHFSNQLGFYRLLGALDRPIDSLEDIHLSAKERYRDLKPDYLPAGLKPFQAQLEEFVATVRE